VHYLNFNKLYRDITKYYQIIIKSLVPTFAKRQIKIVNKILSRDVTIIVTRHLSPDVASHTMITLRYRIDSCLTDFRLRYNCMELSSDDSHEDRQ
jgi:hypothetical protein